METTTTLALAPATSAPTCLAARWLDYLDAKPRTLEAYAKALKPFAAFCAERGIASPCREDIRAYRDSLVEAGRAPTTIRLYLAAVKGLYRFAAAEGLSADEAHDIRAPKVGTEHRKGYLSAEQVREVLAATPSARDKAVIALAAVCGLRCVEIVRANVADLRRTASGLRLFVQGKGRDERTESVAVPPQVETLLCAYLADRNEQDPNAPLFCSSANRNNGARLTTRSVSRLAKEAFRRCGIDTPWLTAHSLRHTAVTLALKANGGNLEEARQFARHASISTTQIYNHALEAERNTCAASVASQIF